MTTPLNCLEQVIKDLTGQETALRGYRSPYHGLVVRCFPEQYVLGMPFLQLSFKETVGDPDDDELVTIDKIPTFFRLEQEYKDDGRQDISDIMFMYHLGTVFADGNPMSGRGKTAEIRVTSSIPTTARSDASSVHVYPGKIYKADKKELQAFLNEAEGKGNVEYKFYANFVSYGLVPEQNKTRVYLHPTKKGAETVAEMEAMLAQMKPVLDALKKYEATIKAFVDQANKQRYDSFVDHIVVDDLRIEQ